MELKGKVVHEIQPSAKNKRNSEGAFLELRDGRIIYMYSKFLGTGGDDYDYAVIAETISDDGGNTWSEDEIVFTAEEHKAINIMSVSLLRFKNGDIGVFYFVRYGWDDGRLWLRRSRDEGKTWSDAICCISDRGYHVVNNDRVIYLSTGRIIFASAYHKKSEGCENITYCSNAHFHYSDDDGYTWHTSAQILSQNYRNSNTGLQEPGILELSANNLWGWARTDLGCQYEFFSHDNGITWSQPEPSRFTSPTSPMYVKRIGDTNSLIAVWNPIPNYISREATLTYGGRTRLVYAVSEDNGITWGESTAIEDSSTAGYAYTAIHFTHDGVIFAYYYTGESADAPTGLGIRIKFISFENL